MHEEAGPRAARGRYFHSPPRFAPDDIRSNWYTPSGAASEFARYAVFEDLVTASRSMAQLALRYLLDQPTTGTIILGAKAIGDYDARHRSCRRSCRGKAPSWPSYAARSSASCVLYDFWSLPNINVRKWNRIVL
jgi:hypothetical protein